MKKSDIKKIVNIETNKIAYEIANKISDKTDVASLENNIVAIAYVLIIIKEHPNSPTNSLDDFIDFITLDNRVKEALKREITKDLWECALELTHKDYDTEALKALILFNRNYSFNKNRMAYLSSTPDSLSELAKRILDIKNGDSLLDLCSGTGSFFSRVAIDNKDVNYNGVEINYKVNDIAVLRTSLITDVYNFEIGDAFTYNAVISGGGIYVKNMFDKIFSNYPFNVRLDVQAECKIHIRDYYRINHNICFGASSDWILNAKIVSMLKENGKAVAIMTNGATLNKNDKDIRKFLVQRGNVEAVINLPEKLFPGINISVSMIVFGNNNKFVRLINAEKNFSEVDKQIVLSENNISEILEKLSYGGNDTIDIEINSEKLKENDYKLYAPYYTNKPLISEGEPFGNVIKSISRGSQRPDALKDAISDSPTEYKYVSLSNINNGLVDINNEGQYLKEITKGFSKYVIPDNAMILSKIATPTFRSAIVNSEYNQKLVATGNIYIIEIDTTKANPYYIQAFFDSDLGEKTLLHSSIGTVAKTISAEALKNMIIPLPSLEKQNEIASKYQAYLDELVILKNKVNKVIEKKRNCLEKGEI